MVILSMEAIYLIRRSRMWQLLPVNPQEVARRPLRDRLKAPLPLLNFSSYNLCVHL